MIRDINMKQFVKNYHLTGKEFKRIRMKYNCTQNSIAEFLGVSKKTIERWEGNNCLITGSEARLMKMIDDDPTLLSMFEIPDKKYPLRITYKLNADICTIIDVDEASKKIEIKNYCKNYLNCAFGKNENPTYEDYEHFLESRCFPKTRDKMKIMLKMLEIPFYDPMLIIEKTKGRMAEDNFWLDIERD